MFSRIVPGTALLGIDVSVEISMGKTYQDSWWDPRVVLGLMLDMWVPCNIIFIVLGSELQNKHLGVDCSVEFLFLLSFSVLLPRPPTSQAGPLTGRSEATGTRSRVCCTPTRSPPATTRGT